MASKLTYLMQSYPQFVDEIRLLDQHNADFQKLSNEYHHLIHLSQEEAKESQEEQDTQNLKQAKLKQSIESMLIKHALAAGL